MNEEPTQRHTHLHAYTLSIEDAARVLEQPTEEVWRAIRAGLLPYIRVHADQSAEYRLLPEDVLDLHAQTQSSAGAVLRDDAPVGLPGSSGNAHGEPRIGGHNGHLIPLVPVVATATIARLDTAIPVGKNGELEPLLRRLIEEVTAPLRVMNEQLAADNVRLQELVQAQAAALLQHQQKSADLEHDLESLPASFTALQARVDVQQFELEQLRLIQYQETEQGYQAAWQRIQRRPWWLRIPDIG